MLMTPILGPLPPVAQRQQFLADEDHRALLDHVLANRDKFSPAVVNKGQVDSVNRVDPAKRIALTTRTIGPLEPLLRDRLGAALADLAAQFGLGFTADSLELEFAAHGDGAFFGAHTDIPIGANRTTLSDEPGHDRVVSAVYYFYATPRQFSGGNLRLYRFGADPQGDGQDPANHLDLAPTDNSLVAFPSTVRHEVTRVSCPSGRFDDYRFALNCWYCAAR